MSDRNPRQNPNAGSIPARSAGPYDDQINRAMQQQQRENDQSKAATARVELELAARQAALHRPPPAI